MTSIKGFKLSDMKVTKLLENYEPIGFQATNIGRAVKILKRMKKDKATVYLSFTSNIISYGLL